ncbi:MAG TPA: SURF1 family protein [Longimicrobium sp.]|uniref:SURF1 family protein n=1 Tax=Longimicrobium sp. TaxID=2029185 RepID=UPI002EDA14BD
MKFSARGVAAALFVVVVAGVCVRLGFWQLDRLAQRRARNAAIEAATRLPPLTLTPARFDSMRGDPQAYAWRRVRAAGRYDHTRDLVLRGKAREGMPGVQIATPLILSDGRAVVVLRGWASSPDAGTVDARALQLRNPNVEVEGLLQPIGAEADRGLPAAGRAGADTTWRRLNLLALRDRQPGVQLLPLSIQRLDTDRSDDPAAALPMPEISEGSHLSYAVQWFSFAFIAVAGFLIVAFRRKPRPAP